MKGNEISILPRIVFKRTALFVFIADEQPAGNGAGSAAYLRAMLLRLATAADVRQLNVLVNGAYRGEGSKQGWTTEADLLGGQRVSEQQLNAMLLEPETVLLVAEDNEQLHGCVYLQKQAEALYLGMLTVRPELQAAGIGSLLMRAAEERAVALGCTKIKMTVITVRDTLIAYYQRRGYTDTGDRLPFPTDPKFGLPRQPLEFMVMEKIMA